MFDQLIGQTLAGKYRIDERLREDATSTTYYAVHTLIHKPVTLKVLRPNFAADSVAVGKFQDEARLLSRIAHPNILSVTDYGTDANAVPFLVFENFSTRTLRDVVADEKQLPLGRAKNIANGICGALAAAHANGVVHGNLSGDDVLIDDTGADTVKIVGFGGAPRVSTADTFEGTGITVENAFYRAPEQFERAEAVEVDERADIYALGAMLYEMLAGRPPFGGESAAEVVRKHIGEIPPSLLAVRPDLPPAVEMVVQRALAKQPAGRFQTIAEFNDALASATRNAGDEDTVVYPRAFAAPAAAQIAPIELANDARWRTAFIVLAGISLLTAGLFFVTQTQRTNPTTTMGVDPNGNPVQPVNPPSSGIEDLSNSGFAVVPTPAIDPLTGLPIPPQTTGVIPGGNPFPPSGGGSASQGDVYGFGSGRIPPGVPTGPVVTIPGDSTSPFMQDGGAIVTGNTNAGARPSPSVKPSPQATASATPNTATTPPAAGKPSPTANPTAAPTAAAQNTPRPRTPRATTPPASSQPNEPARPQTTPNTQD